MGKDVRAGVGVGSCIACIETGAGVGSCIACIGIEETGAGVGPCIGIEETGERVGACIETEEVDGARTGEAAIACIEIGETGPPGSLLSVDFCTGPGILRREPESGTDTLGTFCGAATYSLIYCTPGSLQGVNTDLESLYS